MARPRVLITGFGPFPGVSENPSGWLAETLAGQGQAFGCDLHGAVLPTEWDAVATLTPRLHESLQPHVMIHYGVSPNAKALRIERSAHNRAASRADARGALPDTAAISSNGADRLDTSLPVTALAAYLRSRDVAAGASRSCGRYLCNFLYYRSLEWTRTHGSDALFVHVPLTRAQGGSLETDALLHAGAETLRFVLDGTNMQDTPTVRAQSPAVSRPPELRR